MTTPSTSRVLRLLVCALAVTAAGRTAAADLADAQRDGYLVWIHSLEQTVAGREAADQDERRLLFPYDEPAWEREERATPYRHLAIGKAVQELEERWRGRDVAPTPLAALAHARNYARLAEWDSALAWYGVARRADRAGRLGDEVDRETLATALAAGDSAAAARAVEALLRADDLAGRPDEAVLAVRWLLVARQADTLDRLLARVASLDTLATPRLRFWRARALSWRERRADCLEALLDLVAAGQGRSLGLAEDERAWVLAAVPDLLLLDGRTGEARELYRRLAVSSLPALAMWGRYQIAGLDLAAARYRAAAEGYATVCDGPRHGTWQDQACALRGLAEELERIRAEGEPYGTAAFYRR